MGLIDQVRAQGHAVESIVRVLREQVVKIAARAYRAWRKGRVAVRTVTDAPVVDAIRDAVWITITVPDGTVRRKIALEGLYWRRKMTALIRRTALPGASLGAVGRAMQLLELEVARRSKGVRTTIPGKGAIRAGNLLSWNSPRPPGLTLFASGTRLFRGHSSSVSSPPVAAREAKVA